MVTKPGPAPSLRIDLFDTMGGTAKCRELSSAFYARVAKDPILRPLFPGKTFRCAIEEFSAFLVQLLGGPPEDTQFRWWLSLHESHRRFGIGQKERDAWIGHMTRALDDVELSEEMRGSLHALFTEASAYVVNTGPISERPRSSWDESEIHAQIGRRWEEQRALDSVVATVREGDLTRMLTILSEPPLERCFGRNRTVFANFAGVLIGSGNDDMAGCAHRILLENPDLAHKRYAGRTLLHAASAAGNLAIVEALLGLGVDPNVQDGGEHTPLYSVANECRGGGPVVRALVHAGAKVDACDGAKRCTALHMAARRGNTEAIEALLACGANIEARDSAGDTPLRRAVNCGQTGVAAFLLSKGADRRSVGSKGLTPLAAARTQAMRDVLNARR